jgi:hypothetical protein
MSTSSRATLLNKLQKFLKRTYKATPVKGEQPLMESMLFAACLENARHDVAVQSLEKLRAAFFDWNEIRVSTVKELAEAMAPLPEPGEAATRVKGILQSVFESDYSFDLEHLKKQNIGAAVKRLQKLQGATPFNVAYATQTALGGHSIPLDKGTLGVLVVLGMINDSEAQAGVVPGMERAISKNKGQEFAALLHELGADFFANPFSPALRERLLSIAPDAKDRFPKRASKKAAPEPPHAPPSKASADGKKKASKRDAGKQTVAAKKQKTAEKPAARASKGATSSKKKSAPSGRKAGAPTMAKRKPR